MKKIGIIGFGRFGQLMAKHLKEKFRVFVSDQSDKQKDAEKMGVEFTSLEECAKKEIVILSVPISKFRETLEKIVPFLKNGSLILDVCSVKEMPVKAMKEKLPETVECIGTHPLFGPDTAKNGLKGLKIVLCPVRVNSIEKIENFLTELGLETIISTPKEHDKQISKSLLFIHFLSKALLNMEIEKINIATKTHENLMELIEIVKNDSDELFKDMNSSNRFAESSRTALIKEMIKLNEELK